MLFSAAPRAFPGRDLVHPQWTSKFRRRRSDGRFAGGAGERDHPAFRSDAVELVEALSKR